MWRFWQIHNTNTNAHKDSNSNTNTYLNTDSNTDINTNIDDPPARCCPGEWGVAVRLSRRHQIQIQIQIQHVALSPWVVASHMHCLALPCNRWNSVIVLFGRGLGVAPSVLMGSPQILTDNDDDLEDLLVTMEMAINALMQTTG